MLRRKRIEIERLPAFWSEDAKGKYTRLDSLTMAIRHTKHSVTYSTHPVPGIPKMLIQKRVSSEDGKVTWDVGNLVKREEAGIGVKPITKLRAKIILSRLAKQNKLP